MSATPTGLPPGEAPYIRAGGGIEIEGSRIVRVAIAFCVLALAAIVIDMTISAANQNSRQTRLRQQGVPVEVTVTGCVASGSGSGQTVEGYTCRGSYAVGGHPYTEVIGGTRVLHPVGQKLQAVAVPGDPSLVSTSDAVAGKHASWTPYVTPAILGAVTIALALAFFLWPRWRRTGPARLAPELTDHQLKETPAREQPTGIMCPSCGAELYEGTMRGDSFYSITDQRVPALSAPSRKSGSRPARFGSRSRRALRCRVCSTIVVPGDNPGGRTDST